MKKSRYTEEQIAFALRQAESGMPVSDVCRQMGGLGVDRRLPCDDGSTAVPHLCATLAIACGIMERHDQD